MRILNYEVHFSITRRHSFWDLFRSPDEDKGEYIDRYELPPLPTKWVHKINPEKRLHAMHSDILVYAFRDVVAQMLMHPEKAGAIFLSIVSFTETFKNDMILKGANEESVNQYNEAVNEHIDNTMYNLNRNNPELYSSILDYLEDDKNDS